MSPALGVSTTATVLAVVGLAVGLIVFFVVVWLLNSTLAPLRRVLTDLQSAKKAPMLERGVPGTEQLGTTRRLAESVPDLALAYLQKLSLSPQPAAPASEPAAPAERPPPAPTPASTGLATQQDDPRLPAWKRNRG